jgi:hypothetical protein
MNPAPFVFVGLGLVAAFLLKTFVLDPNDMFVMQGGARFWKPTKAAELKKALASLKATPHSTVADVWVLSPASGEDALALIQKIRESGSVVATTPNLLDPHATDKAMSKVTPAQLATFADKSAAILPTL